LKTAVSEAVSAEIARFVTDAAVAWQVPGQVLALVEAAARDTANRIGQALIQHALQVPAGRAPEPVPCQEGHRVRRVGVRTRTIRTALGPVSLERAWWHCSTCHAGFAPLEARYGIGPAGTSPGFDKVLALAGTEHPYRASASLITELTGIVLASASEVARTTRRVGVAARDRANAETAAIKTGAVVPLMPGPAPDVGYLLIDGTGAPMVPRETEGRPGKYPDGRARTREVKIGCLFTQATATPGGEPARDPGSVSYLATFADAAGFADQLSDEHRRRGFDRIRQPIVIGDGAKWIWSIAERLFPEATHIVDYWHACEHVHDLVKIFDHLLADPKAFTHQLIDHLDHGDITGIINQVNTLHLDHYKGTLAERTHKALDYFTSNSHRMQYHHYRAHGWFIGSGPVEAACKAIVAARAKQAGMRWTTAGLDPVLTLRTLTRSDRHHTIWGNDPSQTTPSDAA
jgi:hypothetical protein